MNQPLLSLVVLGWNNLNLTRACVESLRSHTDVAYELIIVDNGSTDGAAEFAREAADVAVINPSNFGFAAGMNTGLAVAEADFVAFINNDTVFPVGWASHLIETWDRFPDAGIGLPAVTAAGNPVSVRSSPGTRQIELKPFGEFPSGVVYVIPRELIVGLGGWNEGYGQASAEDLDLCFSVWAHGYSIIIDERVLIDHLSQATVRQVPDRKDLYRQNLEKFLERWSSPAGHEPKLPSVDPVEFRHNLERAGTAVVWIRRMLEARDEAAALRSELRELEQGSTRRKRWFKAR